MARAKKDEQLLDANGNPCTLEAYWESLTVPNVEILDRDGVLRILSAVALDPASPPPSRVRAAEICAKMQNLHKVEEDDTKQKTGMSNTGVEKVRRFLLGMAEEESDADDDSEEDGE